MMSDTAWVTASLHAAVRDNLAYWSAQPPRVLRAEANNLYRAVQHGLHVPATRSTAARLLNQSFAAAQSQPQRWLALHATAHSLRQLPTPLRAELQYQRAALLWLMGQTAQAAAAFARTQTQAARYALPALQARCLIGLCLIHAQQPRKALRAASQLAAMLPRLPKALMPQAQATLGQAAYFAKDYAAAAQHFANALDAAPASSQLRGQLHIFAGLSLHAQDLAEAALRHYNAAARVLQSASPTLQARVELLRATAHYHTRARGQQVRLQPAIAALHRAAALLQQSQLAAEGQAELEALLGRAYTRSGDVGNGLRYLRSALQLTEELGAHSLATDIFAALTQLENKNPA